jgi:hypothetical protein
LATPLGSKVEEVEKFLDARGFVHRPGKKDSSYFEFYLRTAPPGNYTAIEVELGEYQGLPWWVFVRGLWVFDEEGRLIEINVYKFYDSP